MAAIMQQSVPAQDTSAARAFWQSKMQEHPNLAGLLAIAGEVAGWFLNGHFLVWLGQWVVLTCGRIAEKGMLFAVLWLTADYIAYDFFAHLLGGTATTLSVFSLLALTILPEVILYSAVITTLNHALAFMRNRRDYASLSWAILYVIPTGAFVCMTVGMLYQLAVSHYHFQQAGDLTLVIRVLAGWFFSLVTLIHAAIGKRHETVITPAKPSVSAQPIDYAEIARQLLPTLRDEFKQANGDVIQELRSGIQAQIERLGEQIAAKSEPVDEPEQENIVNLQSYREVQEDETADELETRPRPRITVNLQTAKSETKREPAKGSGTAQEKAARILKRTPQITASELAKRTGCTPQYAGRLLKRQSVH